MHGSGLCGVVFDIDGWEERIPNGLRSLWSRGEGTLEWRGCLVVRA